MDFINDKDKIQKYITHINDEFKLAILPRDLLKETDNLHILNKIPVPINKDEKDKVSSLQLAINMMIVLACNTNFKHKNNYITFILKNIGQDMSTMLLHKGIDYANKKEYIDALIMFRAVLILDNNSLDSLYNYALVCRDIYNECEDDEEKIALFKVESIEALEELTLKHPDYSMGYYHLGYSYLNMGLYLKAKITWESFLDSSSEKELIEEINERISLLEDPIDIERGANFILSGRYTEGIEVLSNYKQGEFGEWWPLWYNLGIAYSALEQYDEAIESFLTVLTYSSSNTVVMQELSELYAVIGDEEKAEKYRNKINLININEFN